LASLWGRLERYRKILFSQQHRMTYSAVDSNAYEAWYTINPYRTPFQNPVFIRFGMDEMSGIFWRRLGKAISQKQNQRVGIDQKIGTVGEILQIYAL
jgi:hypothetical protein